MNAFQMARPRGPDMPSAKPKTCKTGARPPLLKGSGEFIKTMDRNGRYTVRMASPSNYGYVGALPPTTAPHFNDAEFAAQRAMEESQRIRTRRAGQSIFDKSIGVDK